MSLAPTYTKKKPRVLRNKRIPKSDNKRLIIPFVLDHFELTDYSQELLGKRLPKDKLTKMLDELDRLIEQKRIQARKNWKIFVSVIVLLIAIVVTFMIVVLAYGGGTSNEYSVESGKKAVASVFMLMLLVAGIGWMIVGAKRARGNLHVLQCLDDINRRRGVKIYNLMFKFGDHMEWLELYYDFQSYKKQEDKIKSVKDQLAGKRPSKRNISYSLNEDDIQKAQKKEDPQAVDDIDLSRSFRGHKQPYKFTNNLDDSKCTEVDQIHFGKGSDLFNDTTLSNSYVGDEKSRFQ